MYSFRSFATEVFRLWFEMSTRYVLLYDTVILKVVSRGEVSTAKITIENLYSPSVLKSEYLIALL